MVFCDGHLRFTCKTENDLYVNEIRSVVCDVMGHFAECRVVSCFLLVTFCVSPKSPPTKPIWVILKYRQVLKAVAHNPTRPIYGPLLLLW